jgi:CRP-like cAMP-binding protein
MQKKICTALGFPNLCGMYDELKQLLRNEYRYKIPDRVLDEFIGAMTEVRLKNKEPLIPYGKVDPNVYVLKSGIIYGCYFDGEKEKTYGFINPGTIIISYHPHTMHQPSILQLESCGESVVGKISKRKFDEMVDSSHEFAKWILAIQNVKLYFNEFKLATINGTAKERFLSLMKNRPEMVARAPLKITASYLGITSTYLCRLKKELKKELEKAE